MRHFPLELHLHNFMPACTVGLPLHIHICQCTEDICIDWSRACLHGEATITRSSISIKSNSLWWNTPTRLEYRCCYNKSCIVVTRAAWCEIHTVTLSCVRKMESVHYSFRFSIDAAFKMILSQCFWGFTFSVRRQPDVRTGGQNTCKHKSDTVTDGTHQIYKNSMMEQFNPCALGGQKSHITNTTCISHITTQYSCWHLTSK